MRNDNSKTKGFTRTQRSLTSFQLCQICPMMSYYLLSFVAETNPGFQELFSRGRDFPSIAVSPIIQAFETIGRKGFLSSLCPDFKLCSIKCVNRRAWNQTVILVIKIFTRVKIRSIMNGHLDKICCRKLVPTEGKGKRKMYMPNCTVFKQYPQNQIYFMKSFLYSVNLNNVSEVLLGLQMTSLKENPELNFCHLLITQIYGMFNSVQQRKNCGLIGMVNWQYYADPSSGNQSSLISWHKKKNL